MTIFRCKLCGGKIEYSSGETVGVCDSCGTRQTLSLSDPEATDKKPLNIDFIFDRAVSEIKIENWEEATELCGQILLYDPQNANAYLIKLLAEMHVKSEAELATLSIDISQSKNFKKCLELADEQTAERLNGYLSQICENKVKSLCQAIYLRGLAIINRSNSEKSYIEAASLFEKIIDYKDSEEKRNWCLNAANKLKLDKAYSAGFVTMNNGIKTCNIELLNKAKQEFEAIAGWRDADNKAYECQKRIEELIAKKEAEAERQRLEAEQQRRRVEQQRLEAEHRKVNNVKTALEIRIGLAVTLAIIIIIVILGIIRQ